MSFNGSGVFVVNSTGQPVVAATSITSSVFNAFTADIATGLTNVICRDGQSTITANIPFGGFKITGAANGSSAQDYATIANLAAPPAPIAFPVGSVGAPSMTVAGDTNTGFYWIGADSWGWSGGGTLRVTFSTTGLTSAVPVLFPSGTAGAPGLGPSAEPTTGFWRAGAGEIDLAILGTNKASFTATAFTYNGNIAAVQGIFSGAVSGTTGTFSSTVSGVAGTFSGAVSGTTITGSAGISGTTGTFSGAISEQGTSLISKYLPASKSFVSSQQTISSIPSTITVAHGLGAVPDSVEAYYVNQSAEHGYSVGDIAKISSQIAITQVWADATNVNLRIQANNITSTTGGSVGISTANWKAILVAHKSF